MFFFLPKLLRDSKKTFLTKKNVEPSRVRGVQNTIGGFFFFPVFLSLFFFFFFSIFIFTI